MTICVSSLPRTFRCRRGVTWCRTRRLTVVEGWVNFFRRKFRRTNTLSRGHGRRRLSKLFRDCRCRPRTGRVRSFSGLPPPRTTRFPRRMMTFPRCRRQRRRVVLLSGFRTRRLTLFLIAVIRRANIPVTVCVLVIKMKPKFGIFRKRSRFPVTVPVLFLFLS